MIVSIIYLLYAFVKKLKKEYFYIPILFLLFLFIQIAVIVFVGPANHLSLLATNVVFGIAWYASIFILNLFCLSFSVLLLKRN